MVRFLLCLLLLAAPALSQTAANNVVDPASKTDLITQVNALFARCGAHCVVHIPAGRYIVETGTIAIRGIGQSLLGDGRDKVDIVFHGRTFLDWRPAAADFTAAGTVGGFSITCTSRTALCLTGGDIIGSRWQDLTVIGPGGITYGEPFGTSEGFVFQNHSFWMERWVMSNVHIGGFRRNVHFLAPTGGGTDSFGYGLIEGLWTNSYIGSEDFVVDRGANVYHMLGLKAAYNTGGLQDTNAAELRDGLTVYSGTFAGAADNAFVGDSLQVSGFRESGNNGGPYICVASSGTTLTVRNPSGVTAKMPAGAAAHIAVVSPVSVIFRVQGMLTGVGFHVTGENGGAAYTFADITPSGYMIFEGDYETFGSAAIKSWTPPDHTGPPPPFWIRPNASGAAQGVGGAGVISRYAGTQTDVGVIPSEFLDPSNPFVTASHGYVEASSGQSAPYLAYSGGVPLCMGTVVNGQGPRDLATRWCLDGAGNVTQNGSLTTQGLKSTGPEPIMSEQGFAQGTRLTITALRAPQKLFASSVQGMVIIHDVTLGGSAAFLLDSRTGATSLANQIAGLTLKLNGDTYVAELALGVAPRTLSYTVVRSM